MSQGLPYLSEDAIERDAAQLLAEFAEARRVTLAPPIPIEDVIEKHLRLRIDFDDLHALHTVPRPASGETAILGAIYGDGSIFVDESLDPEEHPSQENRYRFTLAHEGGGHWRLHRHLIMEGAPQTPFLGAAPAAEAICRPSPTTRRGEWQANHYASCLLMPRPMIVAAWDDRFPDQQRRVLQPRRPVDQPFVDVARGTASCGEADRRARDEQDLERFCRPLARRFAVSPIAMRIRLEKLGLLRRAVPNPRLPVNA